MEDSLHNEVERNVRALMSADDKYNWEQKEIYVKEGSLGNEFLGSPPKTYTSSFTIDPLVKLLNNPMSSSMVEPSTSFLPSRQNYCSYLFRNSLVGTKGFLS